MPPQNQGHPRGFVNPNIHVGGEQAMPILGQQPPLPGNAAVRIMQPEEEGSEQALVPSYPYYEEDSTTAMIDNTHMMPSSASILPKMETSYQMDHKMLMFIENGGMGRPLPTPNPQFKPATIGPCYECGGDHFYKYCPNRKDKPSGIPPIRRFCIGCATKHLIQDWTANPETNKKAMLNYVKVFPCGSPSSFESK